MGWVDDVTGEIHVLSAHKMTPKMRATNAQYTRAATSRIKRGEATGR